MIEQLKKLGGHPSGPYFRLLESFQKCLVWRPMYIFSFIRECFEEKIKRNPKRTRTCNPNRNTYTNESNHHQPHASFLLLLYILLLKRMHRGMGMRQNKQKRRSEGVNRERGEEVQTSIMAIGHDIWSALTFESNFVSFQHFRASSNCSFKKVFFVFHVWLFLKICRSIFDQFSICVKINRLSFINYNSGIWFPRRENTCALNVLVRFDLVCGLLSKLLIIIGLYFLMIFFL